ncbi:MAG TPA: Rieske (2Fe-2S) protein [Gemmatimonadaceae bacterium]
MPTEEPSAPLDELAPEPRVCVTRRQFVIHGAIASAAILLAGCVGSGGPTAPGNVSLTVNIADYPALASVGGVAYVDASGNPLAIVRVDANTFDVVSRVCPHQGGTVSSNGNGFTCPNHGARFSDSGTWVGGQQTSNLTSYTSTFDAGTGTLTIG